jgi:hypothetical protein
MKKFVHESLFEFNEAAHAKTSKAVKVKQTTNQKADEAIAGLKADLKVAQKGARLKDASMQDRKKVTDIKEKIAKWEAKKK